MSQNFINAEYKDSNNKHSENQTASRNSHTLFGNIMKESLIPVNLEVESSYVVGKGPPVLDLLIIRRAAKQWSRKQLQYLPDGIRQSTCKHVILELKYTESINQVAIFQTIGYLGSYVTLKSLKIKNVCAFIVSSKTPQNKVLNQMEFEQTEIKGVYRFKANILAPIQLISLNDLSNESYNLWIKLFASKASQRLSVLGKILSLNLKKMNTGLLRTFLKVINLWTNIGEELTMKRRMTQVVLDGTNDLNEEDLALFMTLFQIKPEDLIKHVNPEDVVKQFKPEDVVKQFNIEDRLKGLDLDAIEAYLSKTKKQMNIK